MKKKIFLILVLISAILERSEATQYKRGPESCFPLTEIKYESGLKSFGGGLSEEEYNQVIDRALAVMTPEIKKQLNKKLLIEKDWSNATVDAYATRDDQNNPVVVMSGGLARHPLMTKDAFLLLVCHEIGHHLGGAPKILRGNSGLRGWSSAEGQADYYATSKCLPLFYKTGIDVKVFDNDQEAGDYKTALSKCRDNTCARIVLAGLSVSKVFASLVSGMSEPQLQLNDKTQVQKTIYTHPNPQCRLDTYFSGAICESGKDIPFDLNDPKVGACTSDIGARPACWYYEKEF